MKKFNYAFIATISAFTMVAAPAMAKGKLRVGAGAGLQYDAFGFSKDFARLAGDDARKVATSNNAEVLDSQSKAVSLSANAWTGGQKDSATSSASPNVTALNIGLDVSYDILEWLFVRSGVNYNTKISGGSSEVKDRSEFNAIVSSLYTAGIVNGALTDAAGTQFCGGLGSNSGAACNTVATVGFGTKTYTQSSTFKGQFIQIPVLLGVTLPLSKSLSLYGAMGPTFNTGYIQYDTEITASSNFLNAATSSTGKTATDTSSSLKFDASGLGLSFVLGTSMEVASNVDVGVEFKYDAFSKVSKATLGKTTDLDKSFDRVTAKTLAGVTKGSYVEATSTTEAEGYFPVSFSGFTVRMTAGYRLDI